MARYIDLDEAIRYAIQACVAVVGHGITQIDAVNIATALEEAPAADVEPRAEVAREIFEEIRKIGLVTRVIRSGNIIYDVTAEYTALQKKYTEPEPPKGD